MTGVEVFIVTGLICYVIMLSLFDLQNNLV